MSISIVTVTYNSSSKINSFLNSVRKTKGIKNIILVDNNSSDVGDLKKIVNIFASNNPDLRILLKLRKANYGFAKSCNYGAKFASGTILVFINPDTEIRGDAITTLVDHMSNHRAEIGGGKGVYRTGKGYHRTVFNKPNLMSFLLEFTNLGKILNKVSNFYVDQRLLKDDLLVDGVGGAFICFKSSVFRALNGFDEKYFMYLEDVDVCNRAIKAGYKILYCPHSTILHDGGASSNNKYRIHHKAWYDSRVRYMRENYSNGTSLILVPILRIEEYLLKIRMLFTT